MSINIPKISGINCNNGLARRECKSLVGGQWVGKKGCDSMFCLSSLLSCWKEIPTSLYFIGQFQPHLADLIRKATIPALHWYISVILYLKIWISISKIQLQCFSKEVMWEWQFPKDDFILQTYYIEVLWSMTAPLSTYYTH